MIVDGRKIAEDLYEKMRERISVLGRTPRFSIIVCNPNFETKKYLNLKKKKAEVVGIETRITELPPESTTEDFLACIRDMAIDSDGIIVQFPLPSQIDVKLVVAAIPVKNDVDVLNPETRDLHSPVVGACKEILRVHGIETKERFVTIIGSGRLVGLPVFHWFQEIGAHVSMVTRDTNDISQYTRNADIVVCGAGSPGLLTNDMVKEGVVILDAGTSEEGGELRGDADPGCALKASVFTPVPGGVGPVTVAILLQNVVDCALRNRPMV